MPRHFTEKEKEDIQNKFLLAGEKLFLQYGFAKTTIVDLTNEIGVGKGTFYLFYKSKGDFFLALYTRKWIALNEEMEKSFLNRHGTLSELVLEYMISNRRFLLNHPILSMVYNRDVLSAISDHKSKEKLYDFKNMSSQKLNVIIESWIITNHLNTHIDIDIIAGMMRSLSFLNYHKDEIGETIFDEVITNLAKGIEFTVGENT